MLTLANLSMAVIMIDYGKEESYKERGETPSILKPYCLTAATISVVAHRSMISAM